ECNDPNDEDAIEIPVSLTLKHQKMIVGMCANLINTQHNFLCHVNSRMVWIYDKKIDVHLENNRSFDCNILDIFRRKMTINMCLNANI
ncbi:hypothetical protein J0J24_24000, partial [Vibrio vulnificus]|uniref:hypothetical protein n=1 Tax=Vibrio vulnificus TaxID=672 RepID=UPI0019D476BF